MDDVKKLEKKMTELCEVDISDNLLSNRERIVCQQWPSIFYNGHYWKLGKGEVHQSVPTPCKHGDLCPSHTHVIHTVPKEEMKWHKYVAKA